jgi:PAS domain S-box-containing protein
MSSPVILVVEDEAILAMYLNEILSINGYQVLSPVSTGEEAIKIAKEKKPAIILMDIDLSGKMDGIETAEIINQENDIAIIFLTGFSQDSILQKAKATSPYGYLIKPVSERELIATIEMANNKHQFDLQIKQSEARYRMLVEQATDGILQTDKKWDLIEINQAGLSLSGYSQEELFELNFFNMISFENEKSTKETFLDKLQQGNIIRCECTLIQKSGYLLPIEISGNILPDGNFQAIFRDISERRQAEHLSKLNENRLRNLYEISQYKAKDIQELLDFCLDMAIELTESAIGYIYYYDEKTEQFTLNSWSKEVMNECEIMEPQTCYELNKTGLWGEAVRQRKVIIDNNFSNSSNLKKGYPEGHVQLFRYLTIPVFWNHQIVAVVGVANKNNDYTDMDSLQLSLLMDSVWKMADRFKAETLLRQNAEQYQALIDTSLDGFLIFNEDREIIKTNDTYCQLSGYSNEELLQFTIHDLEVKETIEETTNHFQQVKERKTDRYETQHRCKDGSIIDLEVSSIYIDASNTYLSFFMDITLQKIALEELKESEARFKAISEYSHNAICLIDRQGRINWVNQAFLNISGYSPNEIYNAQSFIELLAAESVAFVRNNFTQFVNHEVYDHHCEFYFIRKDGKKRLLENHMTDYEDQAGERILAVSMLDITEQRDSENERRQIEEKFSKAFQTSPDSININRLKDGLYIDINEGFQTLTGFTTDEVIGKTSKDINIWVDVRDREKLINGLLKHGMVENLEAEFRIKNGDIKTCLMSARVIEVNNETCILSITRDISDRKIIEKALKEREKVFTHSLDMLCMAGFDGYFKLLNPAWEKTLGWSTEELLENPWLNYVHPEDIDATQNVKSVISGGREIYQFENRYVCKDGSIKWLSWNSFPYPEEGIMFGVARDITHQKIMEENLQFSENRYMLLFNEMEEGFALHEIICDATNTPVDYRFLEVNPAFEIQTGLRRYDLIGKTVLEAMPGIERYWIETYGKVALSGETIHYENYSDELEKWFSVSAFSPKPGYFATTIIDITERKKADQLLQDNAAELNIAYDATLQGWSHALELREKETAGHSQRVVQQTLLLSNALSVDPEQLVHLERGALLHDIGKMGIPDSILLKPGALSEDEWKIMRKHPVFAYNLLSSINYLTPALDIPYCHHEKWDGSGYPRKLKGKEIPLAARIFAIIDVWDALTSDRPYRQAWTKKDSIQYIIEQSGKHFDPEIVTTFLSLVDGGKM